MKLAGTLAGVIAVLVAGCGGKAVPPRPEPVAAQPRPTRVPVEDDEPQDGVEIVNGRGRMDPAVIQTGIAPHTQGLSDCYTTRVGRRRWLGGRAVLHWEIDKGGEVTAVKLAESNLGSWAIEKCLLDVARTATFGKPIGGDADFSLPLEFSAKGGSLNWEEDLALRAVGGQLAALDACHEPPGHEPHRKANGKRKGKGKAPPKAPPRPFTKLTPPDNLTITLYVGPQGKAQSVGFSSPKSVLDEAWADCAEKVALAWRLPDPRGTIAKLAVRYRPE